MGRDHPAQFRPLYRSGELEKYLVDAPSGPMHFGSKVLGLTLIAVGLVLLALVFGLRPDREVLPLLVADVEAHGLTTGFQGVRHLLPEGSLLAIDVHPLPNLHAVNIVIHRLLGRGVAENSRVDPQAKGLGEHLRARLVDIPRDLLPDASVDLS